MPLLLDPSTKSQVLSLRQRGAYLQLKDLSIIELSGKDAGTYLHGRSSNDVKALKLGHGQLSSFLDRKGSIIAFLSVHRLADDRFWLLSDSTQSETILKQLTTYHFREQISYAEIAGNLEAIAFQGPASEALMASVTELMPSDEFAIAERIIGGTPCTVLRKSLCGDCGFLVFVPKEAFAKVHELLFSKARESGFVAITDEALNTVRIEAGQTIFGKDISSEHLLPETGLEQYAASYNKGCFQGQEVLARIKTYGAPRRALVGLIFEEEPAEAFALDTPFSVNGEESGCIKSNTYSPSLDQFIALAYIARDYRVPDRQLQIETGAAKFKATVKFLPFYSASSSKEKARKLYDKALQEFAHGSEEEAIAMLRDSIGLDPLFTDAYESLGVILSRHGQYDEAIALMHRLNSLDPDSIMAHTNLSVYYMQLGDKDKAEEEKAISMSIRMSQLARDHAKKKQETEDKEKLAAEAEKRLQMFRQVLAIDPNDFLANNGVGTVYVELGMCEEAIPFLKKTIATKPTHTVAYLALGQAYEKLERHDDAINVYRSGIDIAAKRGDITPMKEMQTLLAVAEAKAK